MNNFGSIVWYLLISSVTEKSNVLYFSLFFLIFFVLLHCLSIKRSYLKWNLNKLRYFQFSFVLFLSFYFIFLSFAQNAFMRKWRFEVKDRWKIMSAWIMSEQMRQNAFIYVAVFAWFLLLFLQFHSLILLVDCLICRWNEILRVLIMNENRETMIDNLFSIVNVWIEAISSFWRGFFYFASFFFSLSIFESKSTFMWISPCMRNNR